MFSSDATTEDLLLPTMILSMDGCVPNVVRSASKSRRGGISETFPTKLYDMLMDLEQTSPVVGIAKAVQWNTEGSAFIITQPVQFSTVLLPSYFRTKKFCSFQRQLNAYGFKRSNLYSAHNDLHIYHHENFHRDRPESVAQIKRINGSATRGNKRTTKDQPTLPIVPLKSIVFSEIAILEKGGGAILNAALSLENEEEDDDLLCHHFTPTTGNFSLADWNPDKEDLLD
mmetsp:Transcript_19561/g.29008  ORF Transcript_19561/g.29008 Transcript_19561/m.29008 type:complete len:228 (-) Transcript_19561:290-973(-)